MSYTFSYGGPGLIIQDVYKYVMLTVLIVWGPIYTGVKEKGQEMMFKRKKKATNQYMNRPNWNNKGKIHSIFKEITK